MNTFKKTSLYALLIAIVLHVAGFLFMNVTTLNPGPVLIKEEPLLELDFTEEEESEEIEEEALKPEEEEYDPDIKNLMKDISDIRNNSYKDYSQSELEEMKLKEIEEANKKTVEELRKNGLKGFDPEEYEDKTKKNDNEDKTGENPIKKNQYAGKVTKQCEMPGRGCETGTPSYKCNSGGKVFIDIKVDKIGRVKSAKVNTSKSTTTNQCILDEALKYARNTTKAGSDLNGQHTNIGYIIYNFIGQ